MNEPVNEFEFHSPTLWRDNFKFIVFDHELGINPTSNSSNAGSGGAGVEDEIKIGPFGENI